MHFARFFQRLFPALQARAARRRGGRRAKLTAGVRRRSVQVESLEARRVLAVLYVATDAGFTDAAHPGNPQSGDTVTWPGGGQTAPVSNLTFGTNAFDNIKAAITAAAAGDTVEVAAGTYTEADVVIDKNLTLQGNGAVMLQAPTISSGDGITVNSNPNNVTIANIIIDQFAASLNVSGAGTLNLTDLGLNAVGGAFLNGLPAQPPTASSITDVTELNLKITSSDPRYVTVAPAGTSGFVSGFFGANGEQADLSTVQNLSLVTGSGSDTFNVAPLPSTAITVDGGDPTPPANPGDTLNMNLAGARGAQEMITKDASGFSGSWTFTNAEPVNFSHIETISPSLVSASGAGQTITATEGVSTGSQVVATFTDPANLPLADYSADINWGDGTSSAGTVAFNSSSGVYSVIGSHTYAEDGNDQVAVTVHRTGAPDSTLNATATVVEAPLVQIFPPVVAPLGHEGSIINVNVGYFTHGNGAEPGSAFTATIDWGDGTSSAGMVSSGPNYVVSGSHAYQDEGVYSVKATVTDTSGGVSLSLGTTAFIREALLPDGTEGTANQRFVSEAYSDLLHRAVDASGLAYWSAQLDGGATLAQIAADIENSDEYRHVVIDALFEQYLGRHADSGALGTFNVFLKNGGTDEQVATIIIGSGEYLATRGGGTNDGFLNALFQDALKRPIDDQAKASLEQDLANGATRAQIAALVFASSEYRADVVDNLYLEVLDRPADSAGRAFWADQLAHGRTDEQVLQAIMSSDEYFAKTA